MYVSGIARVSGWPLEYILWRLPYAAGLQMMHAEARYQGQEVEFVHARTTAPDDGMKRAFTQLRAKV